MYDRYGEEGLSLLDSNMFYTPPEDENIIVKWGQFFTIYFVSLYLDSLSGYPFEWILVSIVNLYALRSKPLKDVNKKLIFAAFVIEILLYIVIPNIYLVKLANISMYTSYILYCNTNVQLPIYSNILQFN